MTLVKFKNPLTPSLREPSILRDPFFSDLMDTQKNLFNLNRIFNGGSEITPAMNIKETKNDFKIEMAAPGLTKNDFKITIDDGILTISSEKEEKTEEKEEGYLRKEFSYRSFERSMSLPETVDESKDVKAEYHDGVLKLVLHKKPGVKSKVAKTIKVS
ncbi:MAG: Hsp20/alpha crystallin family protein [Gillisia sp.]|nr:Hsp20/alpha crystallin family protein [Gillisia sp.]